MLMAIRNSANISLSAFELVLICLVTSPFLPSVEGVWKHHHEALPEVINSPTPSESCVWADSTGLRAHHSCVQDILTETLCSSRLPLLRHPACILVFTLQAH